MLVIWQANDVNWRCGKTLHQNGVVSRVFQVKQYLLQEEARLALQQVRRKRQLELRNMRFMSFIVIYLVRPPGEITPSEAQGLADLVHDEARPIFPNPRLIILECIQAVSTVC